jgi:hypothetical protein
MAWNDRWRPQLHPGGFGAPPMQLPPLRVFRLPERMQNPKRRLQPLTSALCQPVWPVTYVSHKPKHAMLHSSGSLFSSRVSLVPLTFPLEGKECHPCPAASSYLSLRPDVTVRFACSHLYNRLDHRQHTWDRHLFAARTWTVILHTCLAPCSLHSPAVLSFAHPCLLHDCLCIGPPVHNCLSLVSRGLNCLSCSGPTECKYIQVVNDTCKTFLLHYGIHLLGWCL